MTDNEKWVNIWKFDDRNIKDTEKRFWTKVNKKGDDECWLWTGALSSRGDYGHFRYKDKITNAHRVAWLLTHGEIPEGMHVLHKCDNGLCMNPNHLFIGTHLDNMKDKAIKGRCYKPEIDSEECHLSKKTWKEINEIRKKYINDKYITKHDLSLIYGLSESETGNILNNITWYDINYNVPINKSGKEGEYNNHAKLTWKDVREIREKDKKGVSILRMSRDYKVTWKSIKNILENKTWFDSDYNPR